MKVIGLTGTIASGKEVVQEVLTKNYNAYTVKLSSLIRDEKLRKRKIKITRRARQDLGNELRDQYGAHILAKVAISYMSMSKELMIVDGIRNPAEANFLKEQFDENFKLVAVDAPQQVRFERLRKRNRDDDPKNWEEFIEIDERDQGKGEPPHGQQVRKCIEIADVVLENDGDLNKFRKKVEDSIVKLL